MQFVKSLFVISALLDLEVDISCKISGNKYKKRNSSISFLRIDRHSMYSSQINFSVQIFRPIPLESAVTTYP